MYFENVRLSATPRTTIIIWAPLQDILGPTYEKFGTVRLGTMSGSTLLLTFKVKLVVSELSAGF